jgi:hypothetical protein
LGLGFKNPTKEDSYLKSATPVDSWINLLWEQQPVLPCSPSPLLLHPPKQSLKSFNCSDW